MSTTMTNPPAPTSPSPAPTPTAAYVPRNGTGDAVHKDLFKVPPDPVVERAELLDQARILGIGFFVFGLVITTMSLAVNKAFSRDPVFSVTLPSGAAMQPVLAALGDARELNLAWSSGVVAHPLRVTPTPPDGPEKLDLPADEVAVPLWISGPTVVNQSHEAYTVIAHREAAPDQLVGLTTADGIAATRVPRPVHAIRTAKMAHLVPTHYFMSVCALIGLIGVLLPAALVPFYKFWMKWVAAPLGWFNTRLILSVFFFILLTPVALIFALRRAIFPEKDPLRRTPQAGSYWRLRKEQRPRKHFEKQF
jgi:hypothetical protein